MKKLLMGATSTATPKLLHDIAPTHKEQDPLQNGSFNLSPGRIRAGATIKTDLLNEILQRDARFDYLRQRGMSQ
jgi:hypothetical protein